ncbi:hypothetical protein D5R81_17430 [Parashewanella spongiae]|uniref:Uncharacterized protein n=1 Tax=Parashewanella spongiae TaxID=342950 RepID=A0A3A6TGQ2_9GAMM|nr:hypothetical protein D5R81_17430 [Parashewanella spongiae]
MPLPSGGHYCASNINWELVGTQNFENRSQEIDMDDWQDFSAVLWVIFLFHVINRSRINAIPELVCTQQGQEI